MNPIEILLRDANIKYEKEYKFQDDRKYRFDFAIPKYKIAIEYEGGVYKQGRHQRSGGYINDCRKYNLAALDGWRVLRYTNPDVINPDFVIMQIKKLMEIKA